MPDAPVGYETTTHGTRRELIAAARSYVNDFLGYLRLEEDRERYLSYLWNRTIRATADNEPDEEWFAEIEALLPLVEPMAAALSEGRLAEELAPALARVTYPSPGAISYPDAAAWVAAYVFEMVRAGAKLVVCPSCGAPWIPAEGFPAEFCNRPAIGRRESCANYARQLRFQTRHPEYERERRKIKQRVQRGAVERETYRRWMEEQKPDNWIPFDEWVTKNIPY
jgi:hypothetical protein